MNTSIQQQTAYFLCAAALLLAPVISNAQTDSATPPAAPEIRTPKPPATPRINGPSIFGVRPEHPFLYHIPATGDRPMEFAADRLPAGLELDAKTGNITGSLKKAGNYTVTLRAKNALGENKKKFKIVVGETIALTPPMGWNSWNHWGGQVDAKKVLISANGMVSSGLIDHGWSYMNIDDTWQGARGGQFNGIQGNDKFPDMKKLCDEVHALGLKIGIYSTPWTTSYATHIGGSAENPEGTWVKPEGKKVVNKKILPWAIGKYSFATNDANQWAAWGMDYLKYDWNPIEMPETQEMAHALRHSGRDIVFSLSNSICPFTNAPGLVRGCQLLAHQRRHPGQLGFHEQERSRRGQVAALHEPGPLERSRHARNRHGRLGFAASRHLTPDEQYTHITQWCLDSAPLLLGNANWSEARRPLRSTSLRTTKCSPSARMSWENKPPPSSTMATPVLWPRSLPMAPRRSVCST